MKTGVLLINLGTPLSPAVKDVRAYLHEFLMDPQVVDLPWFFRWFLVNLVILPRRPASSAKLYEKIWTERGSPLLFNTQDFSEKFKREMGENFFVEMAMRYGEPAMASSLKNLRDQNVEEILVIPLYPQYSLAATQSSIDRVKELTSEMKWNVKLEFLPSFYDQKTFIHCFAENARATLESANAEFVVFSFHGLPERQIKKTDPTDRHCDFSRACCATINPNNQNCYRAQCFATAKSIAGLLKISQKNYAVGFQSRLGTTPWIKPWSDEIYKDLANRGIKRVVVISPSFVADCLETLEEIALRERDNFVKNGGEELILVPSLNSNLSWVKALAAMSRAFLSI